ncbi:MAG: response regulator transcription factor [Kofleriaceae bacterium]
MEVIDIKLSIQSLAALPSSIVVLDCHAVDAGAVRRVRNEIGDVPLITVLPACPPRHLIAALQAGADDAIADPFEPLELVERVHALDRRARWQPRPAAPSASIPAPIYGLVVDRDARRAYVNGKPINLTSLEFDLLSYLEERRAGTVTADEITRYVHGSSHQDGGVVRQLVHKLRKKLDNRVSIVTRRGKGYSLVPATSTEADQNVTKQH